MGKDSSIYFASESRRMVESFWQNCHRNATHPDGSSAKKNTLKNFQKGEEYVFRLKIEFDFLKPVGCTMMKMNQNSLCSYAHTILYV